MLQHITLLIIVAVVGMVCAGIAGLQPVEKVNAGQEELVRIVSTLTFH